MKPKVKTRDNSDGSSSWRLVREQDTVICYDKGTFSTINKTKYKTVRLAKARMASGRKEP